MPPISAQVRLILFIVTGTAGIVFSLVIGQMTPYLIYQAGKLKAWFSGDRDPKRLAKKKGRSKNQQESIPDAPSTITWVVFGACLFITVVLSAFLSVAPSTVEVEPMTGDFRVAFTGYQVMDRALSASEEQNISRSTYQRLEETLTQDSSGLILSTWGPDDLKAYNLKPVSGASSEARLEAAKALALTIDADVIIYGTIQPDQRGILIAPEFYVRTRNFYETAEIAGQYDLGKPILLANYDDTSDRVEATRLLSARAEALSQILIGLAYYALSDYLAALETFAQADTISNWKSDEGKYLLYILMGNAVIRSESPDLDLAEEYYQKSLAIEREYARALVGLGSVYYRKALLPMEKSSNPGDIDQSLLDKSIRTLNRALKSTNVDPLADIPVKVHFELGQCYIAASLAGQKDGFDQAMAEFNYVISEYGDGKNPRFMERAAESHARIGLIYRMSGNPTAALEQYQIAVDMLETYPERQAIFKETIENLEQQRMEIGGPE